MRWPRAGQSEPRKKAECVPAAIESTILICVPLLACGRRAVGAPPPKPSPPLTPGAVPRSGAALIQWLRRPSRVRLLPAGAKVSLSSYPP